MSKIIYEYPMETITNMSKIIYEYPTETITNMSKIIYVYTMETITNMTTSVVWNCAYRLTIINTARRRERKVDHNTRIIRIFNPINKPDAANSQAYHLLSKYSSTCFGHPHAHHQELQQLQ